jgi:hypothetical protein
MVGVRLTDCLDHPQIKGNDVFLIGSDLGKRYSNPCARAPRRSGPRSPMGRNQSD